jgi:DNA-binding LacI/PurR family transcriptional regulator
MISIKDVAREAGVSFSTVSAVLGGRADRLGIKEGTRQKVRETAEQLGYRRNEAARSMVSGNTRIVCMLVPTLSPEYYSLCVEGALEAANEAEMFLKVAVWKKADKFVGVLRRMMEIKPLGIICRGLRLSELNALEAEMRINPAQVVLMDSHQNCENWSSTVTVDNFSGFKQVLEHLRSAGIRKIAYLTYPSDTVSYYLRIESFLRAVKETDMDFDSKNCWYSTHENVKEIAIKFIGMGKKRPEAVVCPADGIAYYFIKELKMRGVKVPEDVSVTGYGNTPLAQFGVPALTTVSEPYLETGRAAFETLMKMADTKPLKKSCLQDFNRLMPVSLIAGQTVKENDN